MLSLVTMMGALHVAQLLIGPTVTIQSTVFQGRLRNNVLGVQVEQFSGIRYANASRFESPMLMAPPPNQTVMAWEWGNGCPGTNQLGSVPIPTSEDCLFLNVWRPVGNMSQPLPVLMSIHGGGYLDGSSQNLDGAPMVAGSEQPMIVVTMNYRQNLFGFLGSDKMRSADGTTGNWGLQDQRASIEWVRQYISAFGGDPAKITLHGQSAGAGSVMLHLSMEKSRGLFQQAILESIFFGVKSLQTAEELYLRVENLTNCARVQCVRAVSVERLAQIALEIDQSGGLLAPPSWLPTIDFAELTKDPTDYFDDGEFDRSVRVMIGTTSDELAPALRAFENATNPIFTGVLLQRLDNPGPLVQLQTLYNEREYPKNTPFSDAAWKIMSAVSDQVFFCPTRKVVEYLSEYSDQPVYYYVHEHPIQSRTLFMIGNPNQLVVPHGGTIPMFWNCARFPDLWDCTFEQSFEATLALEMSRMYSRFVTTGQPGGAWTSPYSSETDEIFSFGTPVEAGGPGFQYKSEHHKDECAAWEGDLSQPGFLVTPSGAPAYHLSIINIVIAVVIIVVFT